MEKIPMTPEGLQRLEQELRNLKAIERPAAIKAIAEAREHGDLSENAEYHAAREKQGFIEGRIMELESVISRAEVINTSQISGDSIRFSANVIIADEETEEEKQFQIVGQYEADIDQGKISITSPLARALIGKTPGDIVEVKTPKGHRTYEIIEVSYL